MPPIVILILVRLIDQVRYADTQGALETRALQTLTGTFLLSMAQRHDTRISRPHQGALLA